MTTSSLSLAAIRIMFAVVVVSIVALSLLPFKFDSSVNIIDAIYAVIGSLEREPEEVDFARNVLFYFPLGLFGFLAWPNHTSRVKRIVGLALFGAVLSLSNEIGQFFVDRYTSAYDVASNTLGTCIGAFFGYYISRR